MDLNNLTYTDANYMLAQGRASLADAERYCEVWNSVKLSTAASVVVKTEMRHGGAFRVPRIIIQDVLGE